MVNFKYSNTYKSKQRCSDGGNGRASDPPPPLLPDQFCNSFKIKEKLGGGHNILIFFIYDIKYTKSMVFGLSLKRV